MGILTLEVFTSVIESVRLQLEKDKLNAVAIAEIYNTDGINTYDNSLLIKSLISLLHVHFPKIDDHCEIEHYMFDMNFGKMGDQELITVDDLFQRLCSSIVVPYKERDASMFSTHSLIDDTTQSHFLIDMNSSLRKNNSELIDFFKK